MLKPDLASPTRDAHPTTPTGPPPADAPPAPDMLAGRPIVDVHLPDPDGDVR